MGQSAAFLLRHEETQYRIMTGMPIKKLMLRLSLPAVAGMFFTALSSLTDTVFVAALAGNESERAVVTGAVGAAFPLHALIQAIGFTLGTGAGSIVSRALGEKDRNLAEQTASSAFWFAIAVGGGIAALGMLWKKPLLVFLGASNEVLSYASAYLDFLLPAAPWIVAALTVSHLLRAEGKTLYAMLGMVAGAVCSFGLTPLFLFSLRLGVQGASLSLLLANGIALLIQLLFYYRGKTVVSLSLKNISKKIKTYGKMILMGLPSFLRQGLICASTLALNRVAVSFDTEVLAAATMASRLFTVPFSVGLGIGQGYQPIVGYNYTAKQGSRIREAFLLSLICCTVIFSLSGVVMIGLSSLLFTRIFSASGEILSLAQAFFCRQGIVFPFIAANMLCNMTFQSAGKKWTATFLASCRQGVFFFPLLWILPHFFGLSGLVWVQAAADILTFFTTLPFLAIGFRRLFQVSIKPNPESFCR